MPPASSGLLRDVHLIRRRAWLFLPFLVIGVIIAFTFRNVAGDSNAVASFQLETVIQDLVLGGDRGLRIFEAQSMTSDPEFKEKVRARIGDADFDYARFAISLLPISIADGVSRGILTVSVRDAEKANAERFRQAWVDVFVQEYTAQDGLFRTRFISKKQDVADLMEQAYEDAVQDLKELAARAGLPLDELIRGRGTQGVLAEKLSEREADLHFEQALIDAALADSAAASSGIVVSSILDVPVTDAQAEPTIRARQKINAAAIKSLQGQRLSLSDASLSIEMRTALDSVRSLADLRNESYVRLNNALLAVTSAQSSAEVSYAFSGGVSGTLTGRLAIVAAVTVVFGLIAIYLWEWLAQVRAGTRSSTES